MVASRLQVVLLHLVLSVLFIVVAQTEVPSSVGPVELVEGDALLVDFEALLLPLHDFGPELFAVHEQVVTGVSQLTLGSIFEYLVLLFALLPELLEFLFEMETESLLGFRILLHRGNRLLLQH